MLKRKTENLKIAKIICCLLGLCLVGGCTQNEVTEPPKTNDLTVLESTTKENADTLVKKEDESVSTEDDSSKKSSSDSTSDSSSSTANSLISSSSNSTSTKPSTTTSTKPSSGSSTNSGTSSSSSSSSNTGSNTKPSSGSTNSGSSGNIGTTTPVHTHKWVAVTETIEHEAEGHYEKTLVKEAWTEYIYVIRCKGCSQTFNTLDKWESHSNKEIDNNIGCGDWYEDKNPITHDAEYQDVWVVDKEAWTETVTTGYKCDCGALNLNVDRNIASYR